MKNVNMIFAFVMVLLIGCSAEQVSQLQTENELTEKQVIFAKGASNTAGVGSSIGIEYVIRYHLREKHADLLENLRSNNTKVFIGFDYLFPTNFAESVSASDSDSLAKMVKLRLAELKLNYDHVLIGNLIDAQSIEQSIINDYESIDAPGHLNLIDRALRESLPVDKSQEIINETVKNSAQQNDLVHMMDVNDTYRVLAETAQKSLELSELNNIPGTNSAEKMANLFSDDIHLTLNGQIFVYNTVIRKTLQAVLGGDLTPIPYIPLEEIDEYIKRVNSEMVKVTFGPGTKAGKVSIRSILNSNNIVDGKGSETKPGDLDKTFAKIIETVNNFKGQMDLIRKKTDGEIVYELDLTTPLYFVNTPFKEDLNQKGTYVAYGSDKWGYSIGGFRRLRTPNWTNYVYRLSFLNEEKTKAELSWVVLPILELDGKSQFSNFTDRVPYIAGGESWQTEVENKSQEYKRLIFELDLDINWQN